MEVFPIWKQVMLWFTQITGRIGARVATDFSCFCLVSENSWLNRRQKAGELSTKQSLLPDSNPSRCHRGCSGTEGLGDCRMAHADRNTVVLVGQQPVSVSSLLFWLYVHSPVGVFGRVNQPVVAFFYFSLCFSNQPIHRSTAI